MSWVGRQSSVAKSESLAHGERMAMTLTWGEVMMMTPICYLDEAFFIVLCVGYLVCAAQQIGLPDFQLINWTILFLINR